MDIVWIRLTVVSRPEEKMSSTQDEYFLFGPTGIVGFKVDNNATTLLNVARKPVAQVSEDPEAIMQMIRKIRKTEGLLDVKPKSHNKRKTTTAKKRK